MDAYSSERNGCRRSARDEPGAGYSWRRHAGVEAGDGPSILLLHGGIECGGAMWAPVVRRLAARNRVVVPDVPGMGESAPMPRLDAETFSGWLVDLMRQLQLRHPVVVAHSLIGSLTAIAARSTDAIGQLVIYAAPGIGPYRMPLRLKYVAVRFAIRPTARNAERFDRFARRPRCRPPARSRLVPGVRQVHPQSRGRTACQEDHASTHRHRDPPDSGH